MWGHKISSHATTVNCNKKEYVVLRSMYYCFVTVTTSMMQITACEMSGAVDYCSETFVVAKANMFSLWSA